MLHLNSIPKAGDLVEINFAAFSPDHSDELVSMWRVSFERAVGVANLYTAEEQRSYLVNTIVPNNRLLVALAERRVVGFVAASISQVDQLYVHPDHQNRGIGSTLLRWAQENSGGRLSLYTFACNHSAQRFYEGRGFRVVSRGYEKQWQLADVKYEWKHVVRRCESGDRQNGCGHGA